MSCSSCQKELQEKTKISCIKLLLINICLVIVFFIPIGRLFSHVFDKVSFAGIIEVMKMESGGGLLNWNNLFYLLPIAAVSSIIIIFIRNQNNKGKEKVSFEILLTCITLLAYIEFAFKISGLLMDVSYHFQPSILFFVFWVMMVCTLIHLIRNYMPSKQGLVNGIAWAVIWVLVFVVNIEDGVGSLFSSFPSIFIVFLLLPSLIFMAKDKRWILAIITPIVLYGIDLLVYFRGDDIKYPLVITLMVLGVNLIMVGLLSFENKLLKIIIYPYLITLPAICNSMISLIFKETSMHNQKMEYLLIEMAISAIVLAFTYFVISEEKNRKVCECSGDLTEGGV